MGRGADLVSKEQGKIASLLMDGYTVTEIARDMPCSRKVGPNYLKDVQNDN